MEKINLIAVGDGHVGKTSLLLTYMNGKFPGLYKPTRIEATTVDATVDNRSVKLVLHDTAGGEDYEQLRPLEYRYIDVLLVCFSLFDRDSYENVRTYWHPETSHFIPTAPIVLVGNKLDLQDDKEIIEALEDKNHNPISHEEGLQMGQIIGAAKYMECSAKLGVGVREVFDEAVRAVLYPNVTPVNQKQRCILS